MGHNLPKGLKLIPGYSAVVETGTNADVTIPARTIVCQLGLAKRIPKLIYPGDDYDNDHDPEEMDDTDEGLTYKQFEQYKIVSDQLKTESKMESENNYTKWKLKIWVQIWKKILKFKIRVQEMPMQIPIIPQRKMMGHGF